MQPFSDYCSRGRGVLLSSTMKRGKRKVKNYAVVRHHEEDDDLSLANSRTAHISDNGFRILQTPLSPQKRSSSSFHRLPDPDFSDWSPSFEYEGSEEQVVADPEAPTVAAKVAAKRYPTSVSGFENHVFDRTNATIGRPFTRVGRQE